MGLTAEYPSTNLHKNSVYCILTRGMIYLSSHGCREVFSSIAAMPKNTLQANCFLNTSYKTQFLAIINYSLLPFSFVCLFNDTPPGN